MKERMLLDGGGEDEALNLLHTTDNFLGESLTEFWMKATERVGGKVGKIELGEKKRERDWRRHRKNDEHRDKVTKGNQIFIKTALMIVASRWSPW